MLAGAVRGVAVPHVMNACSYSGAILTSLPQIDLIFHMGRDRSQASARVKVKGFVLEP